MAREMRGVNALEGPELGALMAQAMQQRVRNNTTTAQRARSLRDMARGGRGNIVEAPGARLAAGEAAMADDAMWREKIQNIHSMQSRQEQDALLAQRAASMANALGRGLRVGSDVPVNLAGGDPMWPGAAEENALGREDFSALMEAEKRMANAPGRGLQVPEVAAENAEELALLAQMEADSAAGAEPQVAAPWVDPNAPQGFTSPGYVPGGPSALPQATSVPQTPQVADPTGTDDFVRVVGFALTADEIYFNPSQDHATVV